MDQHPAHSTVKHNMNSYITEKTEATKNSISRMKTLKTKALDSNIRRQLHNLVRPIKPYTMLLKMLSFVYKTPGSLYI